MTFTPHGHHLIGGKQVSGEERFRSAPATGDAFEFSAGSPDLVAQACAAADAAFAGFAATSREERARLLDTIADEIDARGAEITEIGCAETGLPEARLQGERGRTTGQLRLFAAHIRDGDYLDRRHDPALPERQPMPRPDLRMMQRPVGPIAVFGASNFPLAFSTAGGDTAAALAAGCPVVVKGHGAHPGTGEVVGDAIVAALAKLDMDAGIFSLVQGGSRAVGEALVTDPRIKAVGFTGSLGGGRALYDLCARRPEPIPFFGELGSVNPMFVLPKAVASRAADLGAGWAASLAMGVGQFCTNPGIAIVIDGPDADAFVAAATEGLRQVAAQPMLTDGMADAYRTGARRVAEGAGVKSLLTSACEGRSAAPYLFEVTAGDWLHNETLSEEVFGSLGLVIRVSDAAEMLQVAQSFKGQLTATLQMDDGDIELARDLLPVLERMAGRVLANGFPTGVEVCDAMVHGGPYPASTNFGATSVGTLSIRRFLRPVCYQNLPEALLPADLTSL
ncbi:aldehyde dehydrogenase (NADP(+)) [Pacificitalea manganoxidans]|uniref:Aldehyde dehydrogenase (NADP(+)) n=1 Tax=Pacificitalea manganoxidans TaxID=1411902 RepID=A0A291LV96_9RHOB|nr:aldehyde dehydrogenase (NADP(+)) [Pacificitalea manganoxidans]ATI40621.1 aldehyde dehydrogenase (NADP(+)) [Pacificitalea manganoxidans]MDR6309608.1 NADP-dependent aldehyde dehydrogenase [Pacificitalea manganoxidans]